jgi:thymidine phosphorylase
MLLPQEVIRRKRDGAELSAEEIAFLVRGITDGSLGDAQVGAFAMAVFFRGMTARERVELTRAMTDSGDRIAWDDLNLPGPTLDKHSTGGVGDKVSLMLAPIVAACGGFVPMISGRGLGHTGGTLDKLEAIPGYDVAPSRERFREVVARSGCAIVGQTADLAPADRRLYAIRDVTATVESIALITASILSKKLAAGLKGLVMDVKFGSGAFAQRYEDAQLLARSIVEVATGAGLPTVALLTDMNQPLGRTVGNALEVREAIDYLTGARRDPRLHLVTGRCAAEMLMLGGLVDQVAAGAAVEGALSSGTAAERFAAMVAGLGGPSDLIEAPHRHLPKAPIVRAAYPVRTGHVHGVDSRAVGIAALALGAGRTRPGEAIDAAVGFSDVAALGEAVGPDRPLAWIHARTEDAADAAARALDRAYMVGDGIKAPGPIVPERIA